MALTKKHVPHQPRLPQTPNSPVAGPNTSVLCLTTSRPLGLHLMHKWCAIAVLVGPRSWSLGEELHRLISNWCKGRSSSLTSRYLSESPLSDLLSVLHKCRSLFVTVSRLEDYYTSAHTAIMPGDMPWPEVKVGNANHADTAVLIVGAGISGICTAIDLVRRNNCRNFIIVEKSGGVGGTWHDNKVRFS